MGHWMGLVVLVGMTSLMGGLGAPSAGTLSLLGPGLEVGPRDKSGTSEGPTKSGGLQVLYSTTLASCRSFPAERTGFSDASPAASSQL
jgi:hypothetical protein